MRKLVGGILGIALISCCATAKAQQVADHSFGGANQIFVRESLEKTPAGGLMLKLQNLYKRPVTAYVILEKMPGPNASTPGSDVVEYVDSVYALQVHKQELAEFPGPHENGEFAVVRDEDPRKVYPVEVSILGLIFDDHIVVGNFSWANAIGQRRLERALVLRQVLAILKSAGARNRTPDQIVADFSTRVTKLKSDMHADAKAAWETYHRTNGFSTNPSYPELKPLAWVNYEAKVEIYEGAEGTLKRGISLGHPQEATQALIGVYSQSLQRLEASTFSLGAAGN